MAGKEGKKDNFGGDIYKISELGDASYTKDGLLLHVQKEFNEIEESKISSILKEKRKQKLARLEKEGLKAIEQAKDDVIILKDQFTFYSNAINGVCGSLVIDYTMEVMYNIDKNGLVPKNRYEAFEFDGDNNRAVFVEKKDGIGKILLFSEKIFIDGVENSKTVEMINHIYGAKFSRFHLTEAIKYLNDYEIDEGEKYVVIASVIERFGIKKINTKNLGIKEAQGIINVFKILESYPKYLLKLFKKANKIVGGDEEFILFLESINSKFDLFPPIERVLRTSSTGLEGSNNEIEDKILSEGIGSNTDAKKQSELDKFGLFPQK